jgi:hypothetical protein
MMIALYQNAAIMPAIRRAIVRIHDSVVALAMRYSALDQTIGESKTRDYVVDRTHAAYWLQTLLMPAHGIAAI